VDPRSYIEAIAQELSRTGGRGLVLSSAEAQLALSWHAAGIELEEVLRQVRRAARQVVPAARGATRLGLSLQLIESSFASRRGLAKGAPEAAESLSAALLRASKADVPCRAAWSALAARAEDLISQGTEAYWSEVFATLKRTLHELPRDRVRGLGKALRMRMAPRPRTMRRAAYRRSLQLQLLSIASDRLGIPPREFLL